MSNSDSFSQALFTAVEEKIQWYDSTEMPKLIEEYKKLHSYVANIFSVLSKKGIITPDPYKKDNKLSEIQVPEDSNFPDNERSVIIGKRLSDLETMLDYLCNYTKFSVLELTTDKIKKLVALNSTFMWNSVVNTNPKPNTQALARIVTAVRQGTDSLSINVVNDTIQNCAKCVLYINDMLKQINDFQREIYKVQIRKSVFEHPSFDEGKAISSPAEAIAQIKKLFPAVMGKTPYYPELIEEIADESYGPNQALLQKNLLAKFTVMQATKKQVEKNDNSRESLLDAVLSLSSISIQLENIQSKIADNKQILDEEHSSFWQKFLASLRKAFGGKEEDTTYHIKINDPVTQTTKSISLEYQAFSDALTKRIRFYTSFSVRKTPGFIKVASMTDEKLLEFLIKQLAECNSLMLTINGLDEYFKTAINAIDKSKVRGLQIELSAIKNSLVKTNQRRAEYASLIEEQEQMRKLGITNEE